MLVSVAEACILFFDSIKTSLSYIFGGKWWQVQSGSYVNMLIFIGLEYVSFF